MIPRLEQSFAQIAAFIARRAQREEMHIFVFTSSRSGAGVTTTLLGTAGELARGLGLRVLAIELEPGSTTIPGCRTPR